MDHQERKRDQRKNLASRTASSREGPDPTGGGATAKRPKTSEEWVEHSLKSLPNWLTSSLAADAKGKLAVLRVGLPGIPAKAAADATVAWAKHHTGVWWSNEPADKLERIIAILGRNADEGFVALVYDRILDQLMSSDEEGWFDTKVTCADIDRAVDCTRKRLKRGFERKSLELESEEAVQIAVKQQALETRRREMRAWAIESFKDEYGGPEAIARIFDGISYKQMGEQLGCCPVEAWRVFQELRQSIREKWSQDHYGE